MRDVIVYLEDIGEAITLIKNSLKGRNKEYFLGDRDLQDAIMRRLEIIGEAVKHIPPKVRSQYPLVPWKNISGARDILIHAYFNIEMEKIWLVVHKDLPLLEQQIIQILHEYRKSERKA